MSGACALAENTKTLVPVSCEPLSKFKNKNNVDTTIYKVEATDEHGGAIDEELRSFQSLEIGQPQSFRVERYEHEEYGVSYTLYPVEAPQQQSPGARLGPKVDALRDQVDVLSQRLDAMADANERCDALEERVAELESRSPLLKRRAADDDPEDGGS